MIVGVAQVVINVGDLDAAQRSWEERGYAETFREERLANHPAKAPFQSTRREWLGMVHLSAPGAAPAVELTAYDGAPPGGRAAFGLTTTAEGPVAAEVAGAPSQAFWSAAGFRPSEDGLRHPAVLPAWRLGIRGSGPATGLGETTVDADGCVLVTLLSTAVEADSERLRSESPGGRGTPVWTERVAGRDLQVAMVEGPRGELVELLELAR